MITCVVHVRKEVDLLAIYDKFGAGYDHGTGDPGPYT